MSRPFFSLLFLSRFQGTMKMLLPLVILQLLLAPALSVNSHSNDRTFINCLIADKVFFCRRFTLEISIVSSNWVCTVFILDLKKQLLCQKNEFETQWDLSKKTRVNVVVFHCDVVYNLLSRVQVPSVDHWDTWGPYGECSRSCGSGVTMRTRRCITHRYVSSCRYLSFY